MRIIQYLKLNIQSHRHSKESNTSAYGYSYLHSEEQKIDLCAPNLALVPPALKLYLSNCSHKVSVKSDYHLISLIT